MKRLRLIRRWHEHERTIGELYCRDEFLAFTMEPGPTEDSPRVPPGFYYLDPHGWEPDTSLRFKRTWALVGATVSHQAEIGIPRSAVVFHKGVRDEHTLACPLLGMTITRSRGEVALSDGDEALDRLRDTIEMDLACLTICEVGNLSY